VVVVVAVLVPLDTSLYDNNKFLVDQKKENLKNNVPRARRCKPSFGPHIEPRCISRNPPASQSILSLVKGLKSHLESLSLSLGVPTWCGGRAMTTSRPGC
jgi:hypothetical protein